MAGLIGRATIRFVSIARSDGIWAAIERVARKAGRQFSLARWLPGAGRWSGRCRYFSPPPPRDAYDVWMNVNCENPLRRRRLDAASERLTHAGRLNFSILVPVYNTPVDVLRMTIASVVDQSFADWELVLVDDASPDARVRAEMHEWAAPRPSHQRDPPPRQRQHLGRDQPSGRGRTGEFLVFLDHDDLLDRDALLHRRDLSRRPSGYRPAFTATTTRSTWTAGVTRRNSSPTGRPSCCCRSAIRAISRRFGRSSSTRSAACEPGSKARKTTISGCGPASERRRVGHVPQLLYHWRVLPGSTASSGNCKPASFEAGRKAVEEAFHRRGVSCTVKQAEWAAAAGCAIFQPVMPHDGPSVAILIPTRNQKRRLKCLIDSLAQTTYRNYRVYIHR